MIIRPLGQSISTLYMAAEADVTAADPSPRADDWAETVLNGTTQEVQTEQKPETKVEKAVGVKEEKKTAIPDALFSKKEVEKQPESEIDKIEAPDLRSDKNKDGWEKLRSKAKEYEKKSQELEQKLKSAEDGSKKAQDLEAKIAANEKAMEDLRKQADEYKGLVQKVNIELDPEFRKAYVEGRNSLIQEARSIAEESELDPSSIEAALNLQGKARVKALEAAVDGMSNFQQGRLGDVISKLNRLDSDANAKRGNPQEYFQKKEAEQRASMEAESKRYAEELARAFSTSERRLSDELLVLRPLEGEENKWWNEQGQGIKARAREFWETNRDPSKAAEMVIRAHATEVYERAYQDMRGERDTYKEKFENAAKELEKLYGTGPKADGPTGNDSAPSGSDDWAADIAKRSGLPNR